MQKIAFRDDGSIINFNNYVKPFSIQTATLEDMVTLALRAATAESEEDVRSHMLTAYSHLTVIPPDMSDRAIFLFNRIVEYFKQHLTLIGWITPTGNHPIHFGGFIGVSADYILIGG